MPSAAPKVSVVVPAYNVAPFIAACLESVRAQTLPDWQCIVVDDGSADGTAERVRALVDPRIRLIVQRNRGVSSARNAGLASAAGSHVLFLDGDDLLHPLALARLSEALDADPAAVAAYGSVWCIFEDGRRDYPQAALRRRSFASGDLLERMVRWQTFLSIGSTLVRTEAARRIGGFREGLRLSEDWEFFCRLAACGEFHFIGAEPEASCLRMRTRSASRELSPQWENHLPSLRAVASNAELAARFEAGAWQRMTEQMLAALLWEAGRMNFVSRRYGEARRLMLRSFSKAVTPRRLALFALAQASQLLGVSLAPRLRFLDEDAR